MLGMCPPCSFGLGGERKYVFLLICVKNGTLLWGRWILITPSALLWSILCMYALRPKGRFFFGEEAMG